MVMTMTGVWWLFFNADALKLYQHVPVLLYLNVFWWGEVRAGQIAGGLTYCMNIVKCVLLNLILKENMMLNNMAKVYVCISVLFMDGGIVCFMTHSIIGAILLVGTFLGICLIIMSMLLAKLVESTIPTIADKVHPAPK